METYIGTKIIQAEPQKCPKDDQMNKKGDPGYKVVYEGDYVSWSPKEVFEKAYRSVTGVSFGDALKAMLNNRAVVLPYWSDDVHLFIQKPDKNSKMTHPYIYVTSRFGKVPWVATQVELLSTEWMIKN